MDDPVSWKNLSMVICFNFMFPCLRCILKLDRGRALELEGGDGSDVKESGVSSSSEDSVSVDEGAGEEGDGRGDLLAP